MLNLHVMVAARFADADQAEALDRLSAAIAFFRRRPVIDQSNTPDLDSRIERLVLDIENLSRSELSALWAIHGGRPLPSVLCRVRLVAFDADQLSGRVSPAAHPPTTRDAHRDPHPGGV